MSINPTPLTQRLPVNGGKNMNDQVTLDQLCITTIRTLSMDAIQQANSGHPGTPMALAPVAYCLWQRFLRFDPEDPIWPNRDRFVLSNGHASMLLYSLLHLTGVKAVNAKYEQVRNTARASFHQAYAHASQ
jgi:transketolase